MRFLPLLAAILAAGPVFSGPVSADPMTELGRSLFYDPNLSANGTQSCASCHAPEAGFAATGQAATGGVVPGALPGAIGTRKPPSAAYAFASPVFHHVIEDGEPLFLGGLFHDGRATGAVTGNPLADQAMGPLLNPAEMALPNRACAVQRACAFSGLDAVEPATCEALAALKPCEMPIDPQTEEAAAGAFTAMARALASYQASSEVSPFASRYDAFVAGRGDLTADERFGLALFEGKGKCAACHVLEQGGQPALFTDFTYDNLGLPRNPANPARGTDPGVAATLAADPVYAPFAEGMAGKFQVPTLRNVAKGEGRSYMHNGYFRTLAGVVRFYNTRDIWPRCPSDLAEAEALARHCWPAAEMPATVNHDELGNLGLTPREEAQIVAFLATLSDVSP